MKTSILLGAALGLALAGPALAQSYNAPAGIPAATAPGGLEGRAAAPNIASAAAARDRPVGRGLEEAGTGSVRARPSHPGPRAR